MSHLFDLLMLLTLRRRCWSFLLEVECFAVGAQGPESSDISLLHRVTIPFDHNSKTGWSLLAQGETHEENHAFPVRRSKNGNALSGQAKPERAF